MRIYQRIGKCTNWGRFLLFLANRSSTDFFVFVIHRHATRWGYPVTKSLDLYRSYSIMAHAYIVSLSGAQHIAKQSYLEHKKKHKEDHIDTWMSNTMKQYATTPQFVMQSDSPSSNMNTNWFKKVPKLINTTELCKQTHC
jgi:hypothetical protein